MVSRYGNTQAYSVNFPGSSGFHNLFGFTLEHRLFIGTTPPLIAGENYTISFANTNVNHTLVQPIQFHFNPDKIASSVHVNQHGFLPSAKKSAYISLWAGSFGSVTFESAALDWELVRLNDSEVVQTGTASLRLALSNTSEDR